MEKKLYPAEYNLLTAQDFLILSIIFLKEFIKLNLNTDTMIKNVKLLELNKNNVTVFLNTQILRMI